MARLGDPLFWSTVALGGAALCLALALLHSRARLAVEASRREGLEAAQRDSVERTAAEIAQAARGLLGNVSAVTSTSAEAVASVRTTTRTMTDLTHTAMTSVVGAETVIGLALRSEVAADDAVAAADGRGAELLQLADDVRAIAQRVERLNLRMRDLFEAATLVGFIAERSQKLAAESAEAARAGEGAAFDHVAGEMRRHADDARRAVVRIKAMLAEVDEAMAAVTAATRAGDQRAEAGADVVRRTGKTIRDLAAALRESAGAAKHIARVAQQQESKFDEVLQAMNAIYLATEKSLASTEQVAREARSLDELASSLRRAVGIPLA